MFKIILVESLSFSFIVLKVNTLQSCETIVQKLHGNIKKYIILFKNIATSISVEDFMFIKIIHEAIIDVTQCST